MDDEWVVVSLETYALSVAYFNSLEEAIEEALQNIQGRVEDDLPFPEHIVCKIECRFPGSPS